jgi:hypothetical protein
MPASIAETADYVNGRRLQAKRLLDGMLVDQPRRNILRRPR